MRFFHLDEPLDTRFSNVLFTRGSRSRQAVAKGQTGIRGALLPDEQVLGIALDERSHDDTVVLTDRRVLVMRRGGRTLVRATDIAEVPGAYTEVTPGGGAFELDRMGVRIHVDDVTAADALTDLVNGQVLKHRPRTIPPLYPDYCLGLLSRGGVPDTPVNRARLAERTAFTVGSQAGAFTAQLRDPGAFEEFVSRFGVASPDRRLQQADDMIDWLWAWHPLCHHGLTRQVAKWHDALRQPGSFLTAAAGGEIPAWNDSTADTKQAWRLVFEKNWRG
ncbi:hypothetical protein ABTW72_25505 [Micromonospora sp. NPDC127501]|uniref:hypothetical protein n=1 Tax=Micromonospora sp. NPDC127501 TaxID=3154872 RepID=UPI00331E6DCD